MMHIRVDGYPATVNAYPECAKLVRDTAASIVGEARSQLPQKTMGAEDFSYFLQQRPGANHVADDILDFTLSAGAFFFVGAALPGELRPHHKSVFDFDEVSQETSCLLSLLDFL